MTRAMFRSMVARDISALVAEGMRERPTQPRDVGTESEAETRMRCLAEWERESRKMLDFLHDRPNLKDSIALAAIAADSSPTGLAQQELTRIIDQAREEFITYRTRVA